ncbi:MAG: MerR family transcriptional regulator [Firmicutes bacterium]|nr:MerR family transcriptional regulator [Bacillota bacterium]
MKINQVAELVDISKKNIRFYEDQGLIQPGRDPQNSYREYSLEDVKQLEKIKLLRQLGVSCENIRKLIRNELDLMTCMHGRMDELEEESRSIGHMQTMCSLLADDPVDFVSFDAVSYLEKMKELEKGGGKFVDVRNSDVRKRKNGAIIAAAVVVVYMTALIGLFLWADNIDPAPKGILIGVIVLIGCVIVGVLIALSQRLREVKKGELDEANKY